MKPLIAGLLLMVVVGVSAPVSAQSGNELFEKALARERAEGNLEEAIKLYRDIVQKHGANRALAAKALLQMGQCYEKQGKAEARKAYEQLVKDYGDQAEAVRQAKERLAALAKAAGPSQESALPGRRLIGPSYHLRGGVSRDGKYVAYCCMVVHEVAAGREHKFSIKPFGGGVDTYTWEPRFSPDSEDLAYVAQGGNPPELRVVKRTGAGERVLFSAPDVRSISLIDWMPDGKELLVTLARKDGTSELALMPLAGGAPRRVKSPAPTTGGGRLSPDGKSMAYRVRGEGADGAWITRVLRLDSGLDSSLAQHPANAWNIGWTEDGKFLFYSNERGSEGIWSVRVADGKAQGLPELVLGRPIEDSIQPVGLARTGALFYHKQIYDFRIHILEVPPGSGALEPISTLAPAHAPDWSPDGRYLAYAQERNGLISIRSVATGAERTVWTGLTDFIMSLRWFPDQGALATQGVGPKGGIDSVGLRRVDLASGSLTDIQVGQNWRAFGANAMFSADGKTVTYKDYDSPRKVTTLTRLNLETGSREVLLEIKPPQYVSAFSILPGTGQIVVACQEQDMTSSIQLLGPESGQLRPVYRTPRGTFIPASNLLDWMPDGKSVLFAARTNDPQATLFSLFRTSVPDGQTEKLFEAEWIWQVRVHPAGRQVAIETRPPRMETWVVDNLFAVRK